MPKNNTPKTNNTPSMGSASIRKTGNRLGDEAKARLAGKSQIPIIPPAMIGAISTRAQTRPGSPTFSLQHFSPSSGVRFTISTDNGDKDMSNYEPKPLTVAQPQAQPTAQKIKAKKAKAGNRHYPEAATVRNQPQVTTILLRLQFSRHVRLSHIPLEARAAILEFLENQNIHTTAGPPPTWSWHPYRSLLTLNLTQENQRKIQRLLHAKTFTAIPFQSSYGSGKALIHRQDTNNPTVDLKYLKNWVTTYRIKAEDGNWTPNLKDNSLVKAFEASIQEALKSAQSRSSHNVPENPVSILTATRRGMSIFGHVSLHPSLFKCFGADPMALWDLQGEPINNNYKILRLEIGNDLELQLRSPSKIRTKTGSASNAAPARPKYPKAPPTVADGWQIAMRGGSRRPATCQELRTLLKTAPLPCPTPPPTTPPPPPQATTGTQTDLVQPVGNPSTEIERLKTRVKQLTERNSKLHRRLNKALEAGWSEATSTEPTAPKQQVICAACEAAILDDDDMASEFPSLTAATNEILRRDEDGNDQ